jgi:hypothetical protein
VPIITAGGRHHQNERRDAGDDAHRLRALGSQGKLPSHSSESEALCSQMLHYCKIRSMMMPTYAAAIQPSIPVVTLGGSLNSHFRKRLCTPTVLLALEFKHSFCLVSLVSKDRGPGQDW